MRSVSGRNHRPPMRLDKWLWAARFFKTRTLAVEAIAAGHVSVNEERAKPAKGLRIGDLVAGRQPPLPHNRIVEGVSGAPGAPAVGAPLLQGDGANQARPA